MICEKAYAKINLFLNVVGKRDDGFHDIESIMHSVSLCDELSFDFYENERICINLSSDENSIPLDSTNLIYRAAEAYLSRFNLVFGVNIHVKKKIPVAAGLAGGSSDAAATLRVLDMRFGKACGDDLYEIAAGLGSDVPFCLYGKTALCLGRGEILKPVEAKIDKHFVIAIGDERVSTPEAFRNIDRRYFETGFPILDDKLQNMLSAIKGKDNFSPYLYNIFEEVSSIGSIANIKYIMKENGAEATLMSGSGPSVFGIFASGELAKDACQALNAAGFRAFCARSNN